MIVLVPAYEPDGRLLALVRDLRTAGTTRGDFGGGPRVVVVDDGSGPAHAALFDRVEAAGAVVLRHSPNRGKGYALRRGFAVVAEAFPGHDVVCADSDGQHVVADILRVAAEVARQGDAIVLGARQFVGSVPARSRLGNEATRRVFGLLTGLPLRDTQTGLRGYPASSLGWLGTVPGDRFEYEMNALLASRRAGHRMVEVPIETVYLEGNESSHFRPLVDSVRVYAPLLRFAASSIGAFALDLTLVLALQAATGNLLLAVVGARVGSSAVNFAVNRRLVFREGRSVDLAHSALRYYSLAVALLACNYVMLRALTTGVGLPLLAAKLVTELGLFVVSYLAQKGHVFAVRSPHPTPARARHAPDGDPTPSRAGAEVVIPS